MKATDPFKRTIQAHLEQVADLDDLFLVKLKNPNKNIDDCITYILNEVKKSGCNGFEDDEIFNMAIHYYDEDKIEVGKPISGKVVVNHHVIITEEEKAEIKQKAINEVIADEKRKLVKKSEPRPKPTVVQQDLFADFF
nr:PcfK-like family protein [uncultured Flavobacterium sp.]